MEFDTKKERENEKKAAIYFLLGDFFYLKQN